MQVTMSMKEYQELESKADKWDEYQMSRGVTGTNDALTGVGRCGACIKSLENAQQR